jgi:hypothetical protein
MVPGASKPGVEPGLRDLQKPGLTLNGIASLLGLHQLETFRFCCLEAKKAVAFPRNSLSVLNCAFSRRKRSSSDFSVSAAANSSGAASRARFLGNPPAQQLLSQPEFPGHRGDSTLGIDNEPRSLPPILRSEFTSCRAHKNRRGLCLSLPSGSKRTGTAGSGASGNFQLAGLESRRRGCPARFRRRINVGPVKSLWSMVQGDPVFMRRVNGWLAVFWILMIPISLMMGWLDSVVYVSALSLWALVSGHWSAWQAARVEVAQMEDAEKRDKEDLVAEVVAALLARTDLKPSSGVTQESEVSSASGRSA